MLILLHVFVCFLWFVCVGVCIALLFSICLFVSVANIFCSSLLAQSKILPFIVFVSDALLCSIILLQSKLLPHASYVFQGLFSVASSEIMNLTIC